MDRRDLVARIEVEPIQRIGHEDLASILEVSETISADDTGLAGWIRVLSLGGHIVVEEETPDREILLRRLDSMQAAAEFVDRRLADYERMWDGCGCKIDYYGTSPNE